MTEQSLAVDVDGGREATELAAAPRTDLRGGELDGELRHLVEACGGETEQPGLVVAENALDLAVGTALETFSRLGSVPHEIAETDPPLDAPSVALGQHRVEGEQVRVDVRDHSDAQRALPRRRGGPRWESGGAK